MGPSGPGRWSLVSSSRRLRPYVLIWWGLLEKHSRDVRYPGTCPAGSSSRGIAPSRIVASACSSHIPHSPAHGCTHHRPTTWQSSLPRKVFVAHGYMTSEDASRVTDYYSSTVSSTGQSSARDICTYSLELGRPSSSHLAFF